MADEDPFADLLGPLKPEPEVVPVPQGMRPSPPNREENSESPVVERPGPVGPDFRGNGNDLVQPVPLPANMYVMLKEDARDYVHEAVKACVDESVTRAVGKLVNGMREVLRSVVQRIDKLEDRMGHIETSIAKVDFECIQSSMHARFTTVDEGLKDISRSVQAMRDHAELVETQQQLARLQVEEKKKKKIKQSEKPAVEQETPAQPTVESAHTDVSSSGVSAPQQATPPPSGSNQPCASQKPHSMPPAAMSAAWAPPTQVPAPPLSVPAVPSPPHQSVPPLQGNFPSDSPAPSNPPNTQHTIAAPQYSAPAPPPPPSMHVPAAPPTHSTYPQAGIAPPQSGPAAYPSMSTTQYPDPARNSSAPYSAPVPYSSAMPSYSNYPQQAALPERPGFLSDLTGAPRYSAPSGMGVQSAPLPPAPPPPAPPSREGVSQMSTQQIVNDLCSMGFDRSRVERVLASVIQQGKGVDLNSVVDTLMSGSQ